MVVSQRAPQPDPPELEKGSAAWQYWKRSDAWSVREFALICLGFDPRPYLFPQDRESYNEALKLISRAVLLGVLIAADEKWDPRTCDQAYGDSPMFRPREVAWWAKEKFRTFPFAANEWNTGPMDARERETWQRMVLALLSRISKDLPVSSQAELIHDAAEQLGFSARDTDEDERIGLSKRNITNYVDGARKAVFGQESSIFRQSPPPVGRKHR